MDKSIRRVTILLLAAGFLVGCKKKFDEYYQRPASLAPPIYQQLQARGNFKQFLALVDKAGYTHTLSTAGYWTLFAPNDAAFQDYFTSSGLSLDKIDSTQARAMVQYLLVYNSFDKNRVDDYQSNAGWVPDIAFRRRTAYYTGFYDDTTSTGQAVKAIASNRNGSSNPYVSADNNNKYIPYFTDVYLSGHGIPVSDYNYFYPNAQFSGFNVAGAKVVTKDLPAENGMIHEIDKVVLPLPSIDEYLRSKPEYSEFRKLFNNYMVNFILNSDATQRYQVLTGNPNSVYVKVYNNALAFSPNNENYFKLQDNDAQQDSWSIFVPKNDVLLDYLKNTLLEYYGKDLNNLGKLPPQVISDFLNAHMWQNAVWPSKFKSSFNYLGEEARFDPQADVFEKRILSNGMFYGTNKVQEANVFSSVYSRAYLDPKYSIMTRLLDAELKFVVNSPKQKYTLFMMSDKAINAAGYDYVPAINEWGYTPPGGVRTTGEAVRQRLLRILSTGLIQTPAGELNSLAGSGIIGAYNGEYIRYNNNQVISGGTQDAGITVSVDSSRVVSNGKVYYLNGLLSFSEQNIGTHIKNLGTATTSDFNYFWRYLQNSASTYNATTGEILGTSAGSFYTVFVPNNAAITQAVKDGVLPGNTTTGVPNFTPTLQADKDNVNRFILYHILNKRTVIPDGKESGAFETLLKNAAGDVLPVTVLSNVGSMQVTDMNNRQASVIVSQSNNLSNRTVIHLINNYLKYTY
ncbi:MAG: fasciclin domain-containing protein [Flavisolibacter sp.]